MLVLTTVHPRARGEQQGRKSAADYINGSSPRTRGTVIELAHQRLAERFIPAHAGNRRLSP